MKSIHFLLLLSLLPLACSAQLGWSKERILKEKGDNYKLISTSDGSIGLTYGNTIYSFTAGEYITQTTTYFIKSGYCSCVIIQEPPGEISAWIKQFDRKYVKISEVKWKDYATSTIFLAGINDGLCVVSMFFDSN